MSRALASIAVAAVVLGAARLAAPAAPDERGTPLPWLTFPTGPGVSDTQPFQCPNGAHGLKMKIRGAGAGADTYGYFSLMGERWIVVRYPSDEMGNPDHIWFGTSPAGDPASMNVSSDEPFDMARHGSPCSGWLTGAPPDEGR